MLVKIVTSQGNPVIDAVRSLHFELLQISQATISEPDSNTSQEPSKLFRIHMKSGAED